MWYFLLVVKSVFLVYRIVWDNNIIVLYRLFVEAVGRLGRLVIFGAVKSVRVTVLRLLLCKC